MRIVNLNEYLDSIGTQQELATALGVRQSAISHMVKARRNIQVILHTDGRIEAQEVRPVPARPKARSA